jgi:hypothetical protein
MLRWQYREDCGYVCQHRAGFPASLLFAAHGPALAPVAKLDPKAAAAGMTETLQALLLLSSPSSFADVWPVLCAHHKSVHLGGQIKWIDEVIFQVCEAHQLHHSRWAISEEK